MCGIAGFIQQNIASASQRSDIAKAMTDRLVHRGPDAGDAWVDTHSGLTMGFRRLAIRDVTMSGMQPMHSQDGRYVISFNGEIYNADAFLARMQADGHRDDYRSTSDTEILLNGFVHYGVDETLRFIKGMYAIALYDRSERVLWLMRDRIGEKPLYYGHVGDDFVYASELSAIRAYPGFAAGVDESVLPAYLQYGYIPAPDTIYQGIHKLLPGALLRLPLDTMREEIRRYYDLAAVAREACERPFRGSYEDAVEELDRLLRESVRSQMVSDVPLGAYLSGGIDSSVVVALMQMVGTGRAKTFSIGFQEAQYDESAQARAVAAHLGTDHYEQIVDEEELLSVIPLIPQIYGEPYADSSQIPTFLVSRLAKREVTVALSGDAGDELFCGYRTYPEIARLWGRLDAVPSWLRDAGSGVGHALRGISRKAYRAGKCMEAHNIRELKEAVDHYDPLMDALCGAHPLTQETVLAEPMADQLIYDLQSYHPEDILVKVDRAGMAVSLENRIPMLDRDVVAYALSLPSAYKYDGHTMKKVLKGVLGRYVPQELWDRPKKGFAVPLTRWLSTGRTAQWAAELMDSSEVVADGLLDGKSVAALWRNFRKKQASPRLVWNVLMMEQWYRYDK